MYFIGLDFGTTNLKALLYDEDGRLLRNTSCPTPTHYSPTGQSDYYPDEMVAAVLGLIGELVDDFNGRQDIAALSFASMAETGLPIDREGKPLAPAITWFDRRTLEIAEDIRREDDPFEIFKITGVQLSHIPSLCKILWEKKHLPDVHKKTVRWMFLCNYIAYRLTGECRTDPSQACRSMAFDIHRGTWSEKICAMVDIDPEIFPPVIDTGQVMGELLPDVSSQLGLNRTLKVIMGGHDHPCGALSTGLRKIGVATNSSGTVDNAMTLISPSDIDTGLYDLGISCGKFLLPGTTYAMGGIQGAGRAVEWFVENFCSESKGDTTHGYNKMMEEAYQAPVGCEGVIFVPHLRGSIVPYKTPIAKGAFLGLSDTHSRAYLARAVFEGLSMEYRLMIDGLENALNNKINEIRCFGGGSQNSTWIQIKADILNRPLTVYKTQENTCLGAAVLAAIGSGCYKNVDDALRRVRHQSSVVEPNLDTASRYEELFQDVYRSVFEHLRIIDQKINRFIRPKISSSLDFWM